MIDVEICISSDAEQPLPDSVAAACEGGAATIELCSAMHLDGLTPEIPQIIEARGAWGDRSGLMVMIRPREGDFCYSVPELRKMHQQIVAAAEAGADGVVFGVVNQSDSKVDRNALRGLLEVARTYRLKTTFHRAFDATPDPLETLALLVEEGVDRILSSGTAWGSKGTAVDGTGVLARIIEKALGRIDIVIGGGVCPSNVRRILNHLPTDLGRLSVHAYSGAQHHGRTTTAAVKELILAIRSI